ncbi:MAG: iron-containing alcohol dehydrogenase, partial [Lachnospiraceae bacterium]|nr:iron-containing alcohol dehydrogenase [Lachnospiraceae bacterium]
MEELCNYEQLKLENQLCFPLYACARKIVNLYTPYLKPLGLTYTQYIVFMVLWEEKSLPARDLGRKLYLDSGTLTPLLKKLEEEGYVTRERSHEDERVLTVTVTEKGMALAQYVTAMAYSNVGLGIAHSMAHTLGAVYDTPHGVACAMMLPIVMDF